jgi:hypothetical protein
MARRTILKLGAAALAGMLTAGRGALAATTGSARTLLQPDEPAAKAIAYVANAAKVNSAQFPAYKRGQTCATCVLVELGTGRTRGCSIVPGRLVLASAWCKLWKARAS